MGLNICKQDTEMADGRKTTNEALIMPFSRAGVITSMMMLVAGATWVVDDGGAGYVDTDGSADFVRIPREVAA